MKVVRSLRLGLNRYPTLRSLIVVGLVVGVGIIHPSVSRAAVDIFNIPILKNIDGPVVWTSHGWVKPSDGSSSVPNYWRGGVGLRYHTRKAVEGEYDTTLTTVERTSSDGKVTTKLVYSMEQKKKAGSVTVSAGYTVDNGFRLRSPDLNVRLPLRGPYFGVFIVPSKWRIGGTRDKETTGTRVFFGGTVAFLDARETSVRIDSVALKITSSQFVVPEAYVGLSHRLGKLVDGFVEFSWEYARLQSIGYDKAGLSSDPPLALRERLPRSASFHAVNLTFGITFARV